ncbi:hypothetical protein BBO99_00004129 [Phytophthora kernoviae]|uniref:Uncharacterized protein n=2 Tax=Phytophthora kernoviae TaxID=325452 RepID=A0A3R7JYB9_9STRA|nr:hypothetical protein G195_006282 [Phytophthora kernoviae 00238/432]KAG2523366.1 hypothetical protein JM16_005361 [Phytophthora kernoviae]KAG2525174.1 hypothetical protein JM18_005018 [Phytophthora kernoviae]RLN36544.1 hypothetical protein BBI17_004305 [Phytophthora kernoviae]RLN80945.1 hypothetical protein BBO99_00004129 [Phytophthora kernoviae]
MKWLETSGHFELSTALVDESAPASNETKGVRATPYTRCQGRWRKRPNHELEYLRQQVIDLEEELAVLHQPDTKLATLNTTGGLEIDNSDGRSWKCIAARQSEQADATLMENVKLRALLEGNLRVARALENAIDQHVRKVSRNLYWQSEEVEELRASTLPDELLFGLLNENIENQYSIIDSIFEASGVTHMTHSLCPKFQVQEGSRGATFHRGEVKIVG